MTTSRMPLSPLTIDGIHEHLRLCEGSVAHAVLAGRHEPDSAWIYGDLFNTRVENLREASDVWHKFEYVRGDGAHFGTYVRTSA